jgi:tetratricopeptide (TPR) repeat protein
MLLVQSAHAGTVVGQLAQSLDVAEAELLRLEDKYQELPDILAIGDRGDRATWGAIYHLSREYTRAAYALYGAVEPGVGEAPGGPQKEPAYAESLYYLADSLAQLGNTTAAMNYFERILDQPQEGYYDDAILRLMLMAGERNIDVDRLWAKYRQRVGGRIGGGVRYHHARLMMLQKRDQEAADDLAGIAPTDRFSLRGQYLRGALLTRAGKLEEALAIFVALTKLDNPPDDESDVIELAHMNCGRLLYELDRLEESLDAYQAIDYDSSYLTAMLYEVTLTYVRRGQVAMRGTKTDGLTAAEREANAKREYERALRQVEDLRAIDDKRSVDIDLLTASLRLQRGEYDEALALFGDILDEYAGADERLRGILANPNLRERVLSDFLELQSGALAIDTILPAVAAERAASNPEVREALRVFRDLKGSRTDVDDAVVLLERLEKLLDTTNLDRAELFPQLRTASERSTSLANVVATVRTGALAEERSLAVPRAETQARLAEIAARREELERRLQLLPTTASGLAERKARLREQITAVDRTVHELELVNDHLRAGLLALDQESARARVGEKITTTLELQRGKVRALDSELRANDRRIDLLKTELRRLGEAAATAGGRGSPEETLRNQLADVFREERAILADARNPNADYAMVEQVVQRAEALQARNERFRSRLDTMVGERLVGARAVLAEERNAMLTYARALADVDVRAASLRQQATEVALNRVRADLDATVLKADVGVVDVAYARKQSQTERISALQRARAAELTELTQAYADLNKDDVQ